MEQEARKEWHRTPGSLHRAARLLLVGNPNPIHVGAHLLRAARALGMDARILDTNEAFRAPRVLQALWWRMDRRPVRLQDFSRRLVAACEAFRPEWLIATGLAPVAAWALECIGKMGIRRVNYLTDDPWNPSHRARWFFRALPHYDVVFSPRRMNLEDLQRLGCHRVYYLPFAYDPSVHFPDPPCTPEEKASFDCDVVFAGGADPDRWPYVSALIQAGFRVHLYGDYWRRYQKARACARGHADPKTLRKAIGGAKVALCLVRRANRDGHAMRTFEIPAIGGCMLTEDTEEHRNIFGEEGKAVVYFRTIPEMLQKLRWLLDDDDERQRLAKAAHQLIIQGRHTYRDRLVTMLDLGQAKP